MTGTPRKNFSTCCALLQFIAVVCSAQVPADSTDVPVGRPKSIFEIGSHPSGATVLFDSIVLGTTPLKAIDLPYGRHVIRLTLDGFVPFIDTIQVRFGSVYKVAPRLAYFGGLNVTSVPLGMKVFLADTVVGYTPLQLTSLVPGRVQIRLEDPVYKPWTYFVFIPESSVAKINIAMEKRFGYFSLQSNNPDCLIRIDGENAGVGSLSDVQILSGMRSLSLEDPLTGQSVSSWLRIGTDAPVKAHAQFGVTTYGPLITSCVIPGLGQYLDGAKTRGSIIMGSFLLAGGFTLYEWDMYSRRLQQYDEAIRNYNQYDGPNESEFIALRRSAQSLRVEAVRTRSIMFVSVTVMGALYVLNIYDIVAHHMKGITLEVFPSTHTSQQGVVIPQTIGMLRVEVGQ